MPHPPPQNSQSQDNTNSHIFPYEPDFPDFPMLKHHSHPYFVIANALPKFEEHTQDLIDAQRERNSIQLRQNYLAASDAWVTLTKEKGSRAKPSKKPTQAPAKKKRTRAATQARCGEDTLPTASSVVPEPSRHSSSVI